MADGTFLNLAVTDYTYEDSAEVERTTATTYAAGVNHQQVTIDETYGEAAAYAYAVGKPKFSQAINGVQTWYDYEATTEHDATHKHTVTTKANGELVAAQSRKTETFIAENEATVFTQESIWDGTQWLLLDTTAYEYDDQQRVIKTTRGNGRFSTTSWMCCGKLSETRVTTTEYSADGLTTTVTTPAGATFASTTNPDGSPQSISGTGQRSQQYSYKNTIMRFPHEGITI